MYRCAQCGKLACDTGEVERYPDDCPSRDDLRDEHLQPYLEGEDALLAHNAALVESYGYGKQTRVEEIMAFARRCGYERLGIAFCIGLRREAAVLARVLSANGFQVESVVCKNGAYPKEAIGVADGEKVTPGSFEPMCNPIGQARCLAEAGTQFNIVLGLCVGHDSLFFKHSQAPVTVLAAKDRVLGHNPLAAIYLADGYYRAKLFPPSDE
jgi:uncharacterized metal-binding protein